MKTLIKEINNKIRSIITDLEAEKEQVKAALKDVQEKMEQKFEEAKEYKTSVDTAKGEISVLEGEIESLENDLNDLKTRFGNKDLKVILETGNKEINAQILNRQKEISKQKDKINEFTEKARMIKDLLESLQKDKETKKNKLDNLNSAYAYYQKELSRIIDFSEANPDELKISDENAREDETFNFDVNQEVIDDKPIFDAISSFENENNGIEETIAGDDNESDSEEEPSIESNLLTSEESEKSDNLNDFNLFESNNLDNEDDTQSLDDLFKNEETEPINFKTLNDTIDREYENIFGSSDDIALSSEPNTNENLKDASSDDNSFNIFDSDDAILPFTDDTLTDTLSEELTKEPDNLTDIDQIDNISEPTSENTKVETATELPDEKDEVEKFFSTNNLDFNKFSEADKEKLRSNFNLINYTKTLDILRKNNLKLDNIYIAADIFKVIHNELENIINKLLLAGQTTQNISFVLNALPFINSIDLQDVIDSYGENIKDANITDLIIKAKHLKELGGGNN